MEKQKTTGGLLLRLGLRFEEGMKTVSTNKKCIENLFLVGAGTHPGAGIPVLITEALTNGSFDIRIYNVSAATAFNNTLKISYLILD